MPRLLELFCGTKSVGKVAKERGWEVISIDILNKFEPTVCIDILTWNYKVYPKGHFDFVWASPPCTEFSPAKTVGVRDIEGATQLVKKAIEIIKYFKPKHFCIENPMGLMRHQPCMQEFLEVRKTISYCKYGFTYRKNTDLWTNIPFAPSRCIKGSLCEHISADGRHPQCVQSGYGRRKDGTKQPGTPMTADRYSLPPLLVKSIFDAISTDVVPTSKYLSKYIVPASNFFSFYNVLTKWHILAMSATSCAVCLASIPILSSLCRSTPIRQVLEK